MASRRKSTSRAKAKDDLATIRYCSLAETPPPAFAPGLSVDRMRAIVLGRTKWLNGTVLRYYFFDQPSDSSALQQPNGTSKMVTWVGDDANKKIVRDAFKAWKALGIGLEFVEVQDRNTADVRIGFQIGDGSWSYVGRDIRSQAATERTMNFGWDLTEDSYGVTTALHEIGHTLGMPHEHQNPFAGIVWDEDKVYAYLGGPPNNWDRDTTFNNVLKKLTTAEVSGSVWDPDSVMEYAFPAGLIKEPAKYMTASLSPPGTLSALDKQFVKTWYPPMGRKLPPVLEPFQSAAITISPGAQVDYLIKPSSTRSYNIGTFGQVDTVVAVFEDLPAGPQFLAGDDDSGQDRNAFITTTLITGRTYIVRSRLYSARKSGSFALMYW